MRLVAARVEAIGDQAVPPGHWMLAVSPVVLDDGRQLMWHPPQPVAFNLLQAKNHRDRAAAKRRNIMGNLVARKDGGYEPLNSHSTVDVLADLAAAVLLAFTAIESLANHVIDTLPEDTVLERKQRRYDKVEMTRSLAMEDKFKYAVPLAEGAQRIAGDAQVWGRFLNLKELRDELVHVKERGYDPDPNVRTAYDRLIVGDGDDCVKDALSVVQAAWPDFLPPDVLSQLG